MVLMSGQRASTKTPSASESSGATELRVSSTTEFSGSAATARSHSRGKNDADPEDEELTIAANTRRGRCPVEEEGDSTPSKKRVRPSKYATGDIRIRKLLSPQLGGVVPQQGGNVILTAIISNVNNAVEVKVYDLSGKEKTYYFPMRGCVSDLVDSIREDGYQDKDIRVFSPSYALSTFGSSIQSLHTMSTITIRIRSIAAIRAFARPFSEEELFRRGYQAGFDGSLLEDEDLAMVVRPHCNLYDWVESQRKGVPLAPVVWIDYFERLHCGVPMCQTIGWKERVGMGWEEGVSAVEMIHLTYGFTAFRIRNIQRRWRRWRHDNPIYSDEEDGQPDRDTFDEELNIGDKMIVARDLLFQCAVDNP